MGIVSRAAVVAPEREGEREGGKNGEMEKNVSAPNGPAPENRYGRRREAEGGREGGEAKMGFSFTTGRQDAGRQAGRQAERSTELG